MSALEWIVVGSFGGAIGAWLRAVVRDEFVAQGIASWKAILAVNLIGSALAGCCSAVAEGEWQRAVILAGAFGGFTTFSGMCVDTLSQWHAGRKSTAVCICVGTAIGGPLCASAGAVVGALAPLSSSAQVAAATTLRGRRRSHHLGGFGLIALGGALGSAVRIGADLAARANEVAPWVSTAAVNIVGAALAAFAFRWLASIDALGRPRHSPTGRIRLERFLLIGCAGGLTTMSALSLEVIEAMHAHPLDAFTIVAVNFALGMTAAALGWNLGRRMFSQGAAYAEVRARRNP